MREKLFSDLITALKEKDKDKLSVLRMVKGSVQLEEIKVKHELNDEEMITILSREIKTRNESIKEFTKGGREDLAIKTQKEIDILKPYLPEQLSLDEVKEIIDEAIKEISPKGPSDMGKIMGLITPKLKGKTDMGNVSKIVKDKLNNMI